MSDSISTVEKSLVYLDQDLKKGLLRQNKIIIKKVRLRSEVKKLVF